MERGNPGTSLKPRIHIIGGSGSGKTFAATRLARHFDVPAHDLDDLFWDRAAECHGVRADPAKRDRQLLDMVAQEGWIIEGVYYSWLTSGFDAADVIMVLTPSVWIRHWRVIKRFIRRKFGKDPARHESLADLWRLIRWSHAYDETNLVPARKLITERGCRLVECKTFADVLAVAETIPMRIRGKQSGNGHQHGC